MNGVCALQATTTTLAAKDGHRAADLPDRDFTAATPNRVAQATAELQTLVLARGSRLINLHGARIPVVAARILADVGDVTRFADRNRFASWTDTAPLDAPSGEQNRHRLSRAGNRRVNHMIHIAAISQIRIHTDGRVYYRRKRAEGK